MSDLFGQYRSQTTKALQRINSDKYPDTDKNFEANIQRLNEFVDYIAQYLQTMQKGVDQANEDPISKLRGTIFDLGTLLGGGELLYGIDPGNLQYFLPALGAIFGFDGSQPFPLNLLYAVEHMFLGFIVPLDAWEPAIQSIIDGWADFLGIDPTFMAAVHDVLDAISAITDDIPTLFSTIGHLLSIVGIASDDSGSGTFGNIWHAITQLLGGHALANIVALADPVIEDLAPWVEDVALVLEDVDLIIKAFTGGVANLQGILNFATMFQPFIDLLPTGAFDALTSWTTLFQGVLTGAGVPGLDSSKIITGTIDALRLQPLIDAIAGGFGGASGLTFTGLNTFLGTIPSAQALIDKIVNTLTGDSATGHSLGDVYSALITYPANLIAGVLTPGNIPNIDTSKITTGVMSLLRLPIIPPTQVDGLLGLLNISSTVQTFVDFVTQGSTGSSNTGNSLPTMANALAQLLGLANHASSASATNAQALATQSVVKPPLGDPTRDEVWDIRASLGSAAPTINVTNLVSAIGNITTPNGGVKQSVCFYATALPPSTITDARINLYRVNTATGAETLLWTSSNLIGTLVVGYNYIPISSAYYITSQPGDYYAAELQVIGAGNYVIAGLTGHWQPANTGVGNFPQQMGETRGPSSPTFLQAGPGASFAGLGPGNMTDNIPSNVDCYVVVTHHYDAASAQTTVVKCGGVTMTGVGGVQYYIPSGGDYNLNFWVLLKTSTQAIPTGSQTISVTFTGGQKYCVFNGFSYSGVSSVGTATSASGTSAAPAQTSGAGNTNQTLLHAVAQVGNNTLAHASGVGTARWAQGAALTKPMCALMEDAPGAAGAQTFTDSSTASAQWGSIILPLLGVVPTAANIAAPGAAGSANVPWFGLSGSAAATQLTPTPQQWTTAGSYTYTVPTQFRYQGAKFDIITLGGGAGGDASGHGGGGLGGNFTTITLTYGVDIPLGTTSFSVAVGAGGAGTNTFAQNPGGNSTVTITGYGTITGTGGAWPGGTNANNGGGTSPANVTVNGTTYYGGLGGATGYLPGQSPGGGGGSGTQFFTVGGNGADGAVWILAYQ